MNWFVAASVLALAAVSASRASAQDISGHWVGFGKAKLTKSGKSENFRCRVVYAKAAAATYTVKAACANPSIRIDQTGQVRQVRGNKFAGSFYNAEYNVAAAASITVSGSRQSITLRSPEGTGSLNLRRR